MNGYLVVISCSMDDLPVRLMESESFAREWAAKCNADAEAASVCRQRNYLGSEPTCIRIQRFVDGAPVSDEIVRDLEDEGTEGGAS